MDVGLALEEESVKAIDQALLPQHCAVLSAPGEEPGAFGPRRPRCDYYILGTAHVSANSCEDVRRVIQLVRPEVQPRMSSYESTSSSVHANMRKAWPFRLLQPLLLASRVCTSDCKVCR